MKIRFLFLLAVCLVIGLVLRCAHLGRRPMHNDEGVNAIKFGELWEHGTYKYDPREYHGPSLHYATLAFESLTGAPDLDRFTETRLRAVTVAFGLGLILLLPLVTDGLGRRALAWAALFTAVSPAMVFYSGYYIHEMLLVFFTLLTLGSGWRYWRTRKIGWALLTGAGLGLMHGTKETFLITLIAAALASVLNQIWNRLLDASGLPVKAPPLKWKHLAAALAIWAGVWGLLFSSFGSNWPGLLDSFRTYLPWFKRAGGDSPHLHPWTFYLHRLLWFHPGKGPVWTEALIFALAAIGAAAGFIRKRLGRASASFVRFLALYTFALTAAYSLLAYKTPWCALSFWQGMILLAGVGAAVLLRSVGARNLVRRNARPEERVDQGSSAAGVRGSLRTKVRAGVCLRLGLVALFVLGAGHLAWQSWQSTGLCAADKRNPYVYAQTSPELLDLVRQVEALAQVSPQGHQMLIKVMSFEGDCWPLPWYLRRFKQVGWWNIVPPDSFAPVMIVSSKFQAALDENRTHIMRHEFALRPGVYVELYVELELWKAYLAKDPLRLD